jgi:NAD(P)-dependent dehydrogenase (short-subunit alcohol dehydrogenase family)
MMAELIKGAALVTGAASGIGRAAAARLAADGWAVAAADLPGEKLDASVAALAGADVMKLPVDLAEAGAAAEMSAAVTARYGAPTLVMNNAASRIGRGLEAPLDDWRSLMEVNFWALVEICRALVPTMQAESGGVVVNVGSKQGITNPPGHLAYNIAKSAVKTYTEGLEHELRGQTEGALVSAHLLIPGWTTTGDADHKPGAWLPEQVVEMMLAGITAGDFYILCPDDETTTEMDHKRIAWGAGDVIENRPPLSRWHPDWADKAKTACS